MTEQTITRDFDSLLLGKSGPPAAKFPTVGSFIEGSLVDKGTQHKTKYNPNPLAEKVFEYFASGDPKLELILTLQTDVRDPSIEGDTGVRRVFVPFQMQKELQKAVAEAGIKRSLPLGSWINITHTGTTPSQGGGQDRKEYSVKVTAPADILVTAPVASVKTQTITPELRELMIANGLPVPGE